jgi:hypothetical protein
MRSNWGIWRAIGVICSVLISAPSWDQKTAAKNSGGFQPGNRCRNQHRFSAGKLAGKSPPISHNRRYAKIAGNRAEMIFSGPKSLKKPRKSSVFAKENQVFTGWSKMELF